MKFKVIADNRIRLTEVPIEHLNAPVPVTFATVILKNLTPLELLDVEIDPEMSRTEMAVRSAAHSIEFWDGAEINVLQLMDRKYHRAIAAINTFIEGRMKLPVGIFDERGEFTFGDGFGGKIRPVTVLEMLDLESKDYEGFRSDRRCRVLSQVITDWGGIAPDWEDLQQDREHHGHLVALDRWLADSFRIDEATEAEENDLNDDLSDAGGESDQLSELVAITDR